VKAPLLLYDDACRICTGFRRWLERRAPGRFRFGALSALPESERAQVRGLVFIDDRGPREGSDAVFEALRLLPWPWCVLGLGRYLPRVWREAGYRWVARNRYRLGRVRSDAACARCHL
jgi:predicted DCC family thiol-disulfide oxidoreductase YuxK